MLAKALSHYNYAVCKQTFIVNLLKKCLSPFLSVLKINACYVTRV